MLRIVLWFHHNLWKNWRRWKIIVWGYCFFRWRKKIFLRNCWSGFQFFINFINFILFLFLFRLNNYFFTSCRSRNILNSSIILFLLLILNKNILIILNILFLNLFSWLVYYLGKFYFFICRRIDIFYAWKLIFLFVFN